MSKFDELCQASNKAVVDSLSLEDECMQFGSKIIKGLIDYLGFPPGKAWHVLLKEPNHQMPDRVAYMEHATYVDEEGWSHTGVAMDLTLGGPGVVGNTIMLNVHYKRVQDHYIVTFGRANTEFKIHPDNQAEHTAAYEHLFQALKTHFEKTRERLLDPKQGRKMGLI
jgi:hypothetical protein